MKFALLAVAIGGTPEDQHYRAICDLAVEQGWMALACYLARRYDREMASGSSANILGIALQRRGLPNLAFEAYSRAATKGANVAKVNIAHLLSAGVAAAGVDLLDSHEGAFDAASPSFPFRARATLEEAVERESTQMDAVIDRGRVQFQLWLEAVETALAANDPKPPMLDHVMLGDDEYTVGNIGTSVIATSRIHPEVPPIILAGDPLCDGFYAAPVTDGVSILARDRGGWLAVLVRCKSDDGEPVVVTRTRPAA